MSRYQQIKTWGFTALCVLSGVATSFVGLWDLRTIQRMADPGFMDWLTMAGVTSLGLAMLALSALLVVRQNWAGYVALTFIGISSVAFIVGAFHVNLFLGIGLVCGLVFVVGRNLRSNPTP